MSIPLHSTTQDTIIELRPYEDSDRIVLETFKLQDDQTSFVALPKQILQISIEDPCRFPAVIVTAKTIVGFFVLHHGHGILEFSDNPRALLLRGLSINQFHQGKGYGGKAMQLLPNWARDIFPNFEEMVLAVNADNTSAKKLYEKTGFEFKGITRMGPNGLQYMMHHPL
ncbi:GNAT family N-acetyltransferase [Paenibacillus pini]|uniref:YbbJ protein n=1 Tax=Paenibacillus pini JCM 16418 TaxID=1236976 RepID=W7YN86_9BACL|nr:GNAT family protein [Paenibacillus pini]GAF06086.1 YbbJ protein [Paenibacillus pini JCM 16418]